MTGSLKLKILQSEEGDFKDYINPDSLHITKAYMEPSLKDAQPNTPYQFIRKGYFCLDKDSTKEKLVFNRTVTLKDSFKTSAKEPHPCLPAGRLHLLLLMEKERRFTAKFIFTSSTLANEYCSAVIWN